MLLESFRLIRQFHLYLNVWISMLRKMAMSALSIFQSRIYQQTNYMNRNTDNEEAFIHLYYWVVGAK